MKQFLFIFLLITSSAIGQELKLVKAIKQTTNAGASASSVTNYSVIIKKEKKYNWSIDSIYNIMTQKTVKFNVGKVYYPNRNFPDDQQMKKFSKRMKGYFQISFAVATPHVNNKPVNPSNKMVMSQEFLKGAIIYYTSKGNKKQLKVDSFEELETLIAP